VYAEGAGKVSMPLVEYVRVPEVKGSVGLGDFGLRDGNEYGILGLGEVDERGWEERSRIA
jgi:hypothetical protein